MSTISFPGLQQVRHGFAEWRHQAHMHNELMGLNDRHLKDIGISRDTAHLRPAKPCWSL
jgi:uncharacterized protein YjiS (DUF1127 family)